MNEGLLPNGILQPASWDHPEPTWYDYIWCTGMAISKLSTNDRLLDNIPGAPPPPEDTPNEEHIDPQQLDLTCTADPTKAKAHRQVVGVENAGGKGYGKATGLYSKHRKYSEQWNPWHPFESAHDFQQVQSFSQQTETWIDQHYRRTGQLWNQIIPIIRCPTKAALSNRFRDQQLYLDWRWLTYLWNIILQGYFRMYSVPYGISPISGSHWFWTGAPCWLWWLSNLLRDATGRLVVGYTWSTSCRSDDCVSYMCIRQDSLDHFFGQWACLAAVFHNW